MSLSDDEIRDIVRECDLDWHAGWAGDDEDNRYARLVRAARAQVWREAAEVCEGFDVCDPQHIAREFRARAEKEQG